VFFRAGGAGVYRVEVHLSIVENIAADHGSLHEMDIVQMLHNSRGIVQIADGGFAVAAGLYVDHMHRSPCGAVMDLLFAKVQIMFRIARAKRDLAIGFGQHIFDQGTGVAQAAILPKNSAGADHNINARLRRIGQTNLFKGGECRLIDTLHIQLREWFISAALHAGADGTHRIGEGRSSGRFTRSPATSAAVLGICHGEILRVVLRVTKQARLEPWPPARRTSSARPNRAHRKGEDPAHCLKSRNHALE